MSDLRIKKTKSVLKSTLISMLNEKSFEKINVTDICNKANISRITFYSHYNDKFSIIDEIIEEYTAIAKIIFQKKQIENNKKNNSVQSYCNILDTILELFEKYPNFFQNITPDKNPYLSLILYNRVLKTVELHTIEESHTHKLKYTPRQITGFLCYGLAGFINESENENINKDKIREQAKRILTDTVRSSVIIE